ncbi:hypothetical protein O181_122757, partial [Austropuccinia psidii MF-1]|nr:hypothetical protein [Austropuccinia psidii MF-1]
MNWLNGAYDGVNFNAWSRGLINAWQTYFNGEQDYFEEEQHDSNHLRNLVAIAFIENSIQHNIFETITSHMRNLSARSIYQAIQSCFNKPSWSSIMHNARIVFNTADQMENINNSPLLVYEAINHITAALNTRLATNPHLKVHTNDLLDMIRQIMSASPSFDHSTNVARINASFPGHKGKHDEKKNQSSSTPRPPNLTNKQIRDPKSFDPTKPCFYCAANPTNIASFDAGPSLESLEALLDSGATHSLVGDISLFTNLKPTNMSVSVVSNQKLPVVGSGQIRLKIGGGILSIKNVLYCKEIPWIILSIGQMLNQLIKVAFCNDRFIISQAGFDFHSFRRNGRWLLMIERDSARIDVKPLSVENSDITKLNSSQQSENSSSLWHQRMGHLSIRNLNRLLKYNAADGITHSHFQSIN